MSLALSRFFTPEVSDSLWFGAEFKSSAGILSVSTVQPGSPADRAGLKAGDQLLEVDGKKPQTLITCNRLLSRSNAPVQLALSRDGERRTLRVKMLPFDEVIREKLGMTLLELDRQTASRIGFRAGEGLFIDEIEKGGPADRAKLQKGCLISGVEGHEAKELRTVMEVLAATRPGEAVRFTVIVPRRLGASYIEFYQREVAVQVQ